MGIYISDLDIPKDKAVQIVIIRDDGVCVDEWGNTYGVVSLPPHGRLIDADALTKEVEKWLPLDPSKREGKNIPFETDVCVSMLMEIEEAPTIIEAEPPESCGDCNHYCTGQFFNNEEICMVAGDNATYDISDCPLRKKEEGRE